MKAPNNKRLSSEERKKMIVKSAITAFGKSNYRATRMADIAAEAGVSEAMLYKHFESKKAMFLSILENVSKRTETAIE
ncbi:MAG: helix-turn-helix transcriptional regulator, partial [Deltaproteobacteria bacterium]|nr:helix-turn-helix transcriptional regulator [Deltaproteobacteria bacterium]